MMTDDPVARHMIQRTLATYNIFGDRARFDEMMLAFAPDGILDTSEWSEQGRLAIKARLARPWPTETRPTLVRHHLTTSHVTINGAFAAARTYFLVLSNIGPDHAGVYVDRLENGAEGWQIAHRSVRIDWQADHSMFPTMKIGR